VPILSGSHPAERAFAELCLWLLERYGGDPRFQSLGPASASRGHGLAFTIDDRSRIEISLPYGERDVFLGFVTIDRRHFDRLEREIERRGDTVSSYVEACLEKVGLAEQPHVEVRRSDESWFAVRLTPTNEILSTSEGRNRVRLWLEGFYVAFPKALTREAGGGAQRRERESSTGGGTIA
jgi:hypothetical protein